MLLIFSKVPGEGRSCPLKQVAIHRFHFCGSEKGDLKENNSINIYCSQIGQRNIFTLYKSNAYMKRRRRQIHSLLNKVYE